MKEIKKNINKKLIDRNTYILQLKQELDILGDIIERWTAGEAKEQLMNENVLLKMNQIFDVIKSEKREF